MRTIEEIKGLAMTGRYKRVPMSQEMYADQVTPVQLLRMLKHINKRCFLFESGEEPGQWGRYTYVGYDPVMEITCLDGQVEITKWEVKRKKVKKSGRKEQVSQALSEAAALEERINQALSKEVALEEGVNQEFFLEMAAAKEHPISQEISEEGFCFITEEKTGLEEGHPKEVLRQILKDFGSPRVEGLPPFTSGLVGWVSRNWERYDLMLFDKVVAFDQLSRKLILMVSVDGKKLEREYPQADQELRRMEQLIQKGGEFFREAFLQNGELSPLEPSGTFGGKGKSVLQGDMEGSLLDVYRVLRTEQPAPDMFYISGSRVEVAGVSEGTFVRLRQGDLAAAFSSGKRPRGATKKEDGRLERELLADERERAGHNLQVDLGKNHLGKVCRFGSMRTERYRSIERESDSMQLRSVYTGKLQRGMDSLDVLDAFLPAATLLDTSGNLDLCALESYISGEQGKVTLYGAAPATADAVPVEGYLEDFSQMECLLQTLETAEKGEGL